MNATSHIHIIILLPLGITLQIMLLLVTSNKGVKKIISSALKGQKSTYSYKGYLGTVTKLQRMFDDLQT